MFFSVIAAYVLSVAFAFCGVVGVVTYMQGVDRSSMDYPTFLAGLVVQLWPLAVAVALVLLTQAACLIERWMLLWKMAQDPLSASEQASPARRKPAAAAKKPALGDEPAPTYFNCDEVAPVKPPLMEEERKPACPAAPAGGSSAPAAAPVKPAPATAPEPSAEGSPQPGEKSDAPAAAKKDEGLSFFKLD